jgi:hypothetical protein
MLLAGFVALSFSSASNAAIVTYNFSGTWTDLLFAGGPSPAEGDVFSGSVSVDTSAPNVSGSDFGEYYPLTTLAVTTGGNTYANVNPLQIISLVGDRWEAFSDAPFIGTVNGAPTAPGWQFRLFLELEGDKPSDSILVDFVPTELSLTLQYFLVTDRIESGFRIFGDVTLFEAAGPSEVPIPPAAALFATGLAGFGWLARRRKKQVA